MGWKSSLKHASGVKRKREEDKLNKMIEADPYRGAWTVHTTLSGKTVPLAALSYKRFADKYGIPLGYETFTSVRNKILRYELEHKDEIMNSYENGLFINSEIE